MATQPVAESAIGKRLMPRWIGIDTLWDYAVLLTFVVLFVALSIASPAFLTTRNLFNILDQSAPVGIIACAATLVIIAGGFDLSAGAIFALAGVMAANVANATNPTTGMLVALLMATGLRSIQRPPRLGISDQPLRCHAGHRHDDPRLGGGDHGAAFS